MMGIDPTRTSINMTRPKRRFKTLERALKLLRNPANPDQAVTPTTGSALDNYQKWKKGDVTVTYTRSAESHPGALIDVALLLFSFPTTEGAAMCKASKRAIEAASTHGIAKTEAGLTDEPAGDIDYPGDFIPAQAIVIVNGTTASTPVESKLTKIRYKPKNSKSYTIPFGKTATNNTYLKQAQALKTIVNAVATRNVSFYPEDLLDI